MRSFRLILATVLVAATATAALAAPPPRRGSIPGTANGAPKARSECAYQISITEFRIVKLDKLPNVEPKGYNAPMRFDITLKNIGTGPYSPSFGHNLELALGARGTQPLGGSRMIRQVPVREMQPGQQVRIHWNYDYDTRDPQGPSREAVFETAIWNACNPSYRDPSRTYPRTIPVLDWARDAFRKYHQGEASHF